VSEPEPCSWLDVESELGGALSRVSASSNLEQAEAKDHQSQVDRRF
jgi:hypothetical protein